MKQPRLIMQAITLALVALGATAGRMTAAEEGMKLLRSNDIICLVGGANVVSAQQYGYLETLLRVALPNLNLRIRSLAHEGDTVYAQPRDYNYPDIEKQLTQTGATLVLAQFGQMEALAGTNSLPQFIAAYEKLLEQLGRNDRRVVLISPFAFETRGTHSPLPDIILRNGQLPDRVKAMKDLATRAKAGFIGLFSDPANGSSTVPLTSDGLHLEAAGHWHYDRIIARELGAHIDAANVTLKATTGALSRPEWERIRQAVIEKNRLWFNYYRPMNWAFLNGDRTDQPSSRDHINPKIRWFPDEMKRFEPLLDRAETEIAVLASSGRNK